MSLRHALLGLLVFRPGSGYDLLKIFDTSLGNVWPAKQSQIYGELVKLDAAGLIEVTDEGPRGRKEYALTPEGHTEIRRWLTDVEASTSQRNPMLLQTFFLGLISREDAVERLHRYADTAAKEYDAMLAIKDSVDWDKDLLTTCGRLALEYGLRERVLDQEWAKWAAEQLAGSPLMDSAGETGPSDAPGSSTAAGARPGR
ncbi:PadR family transcriptional regulator [Streptomyces sp. NPDC088387]|uniref:PadR family transcriptional regulator n=1 Tax=Streptomyces sp. NPDC088387 TaxID=3365859 RepID=UPI00382FACC8